MSFDAKSEFVQAVADFKERRASSAEVRCQAILTRYPSHDATIDLLLAVYVMQGKAKAEAALKLAASASPTLAGTARFRSHVGLVHAQLDKPEDALRHLDAAAAIDPNLPKIDYNLTMANGALGQFETALMHVERALRREPSQQAIYTAAVKDFAARLFEASDHMREMNFLKEACRLCPQEPSLRLQFVAAQFRAGVPAETLANEAETAAAALPPSDPRGFTGGGRIVVGALGSKTPEGADSGPTLGMIYGPMPPAAGRLTTAPIRAAREALPAIHRLRDAQIVPPLWFALQGDSAVTAPLVADPQLFFSERHQLVRSPNVIARAGERGLMRIPQKRVVIDEPCILLGGNPHPSEIYGWFVHYLPRLAVMAAAGQPFDRPFLVNAGLAAFQRQSLERLGIVEADLRFCPMDAVAVCKDVTAAAIPATLDAFYPAPLAWLRERLVPKALDASRGALLRRRIFVSRRNPARRKFLNEDDVYETVRPLGFEKIVVDAIPLAEQIEIFADAGIVVGPMGTCLMDVLFAPSDTRVLEIVPENTLETSRHIENISIALGQPFATILAKAIAGPGTISSHDVDFTIEPGAFRRATERLLS